MLDSDKMELVLSMVGDCFNLKPMTDKQTNYIWQLANADKMCDIGGAFIDDNLFDAVMKNDKDEFLVTMVYLYCNWRVWATYKTNKKIAKSYQRICDRIDSYIFDNWGKDKIRYFINETD